MKVPGPSTLALLGIGAFGLVGTPGAGAAGRRPRSRPLRRTHCCSNASSPLVCPRRSY